MNLLYIYTNFAVWSKKFEKKEGLPFYNKRNCGSVLHVFSKKNVGLLTYYAAKLSRNSQPNIEY